LLFIFNLNEGHNNMSTVTEGLVAFESLKEHDEYQGQSTGKFTLTLTLSEDEAEKLGQAGVKLKMYEGNAQRKFSSGYDVPVVDLEDKPYNGNLPRGSKVRILWKTGKDHPVHGVATYLNRVRVLEVADTMGEGAAVEGF
jgi:hypothetical protein